MEMTSHLEKRCFKCGAVKPLDEFYTHCMMADGHLNKCKICTRRDVAERATRPEVRAALRRYGREYYRRNSHRVQEIIKRSNLRHPDRTYARRFLNHALRDGRIVRMPCVVCGDVRSHGHHVDYSKPLQVIWLCRIHHREIHGHTAYPDA